MIKDTVKKYRHIYENSDYINLHQVLKQPPSELLEVKTFGFGKPDDFQNHFICVIVEKHTPEYLAVTTTSKSREIVKAKVSVDKYIIGLEHNDRKIHLAYEWISVILTFCKKGYKDIRYTVTREIKNLFSRLSESTKHCTEYLTDNYLEMHDALRRLLVSEQALQKVLLKMSYVTNSDVKTIDELKNLMDVDYTQAYNTITQSLIQNFAKEWDIHENIVESRLQEVLDLS